MSTFKFFFDKQLYTVVKSNHVLETRGKASIERLRYFSNRLIMEVLRFSFSRGLTSFRDKNGISLTFFNSQNLQMSLLVTIDSTNTIIVITACAEGRQKPYKDHFRKCKNKIYLDKRFQAISQEEYQQNKKEKLLYDIDKQCKQEYKQFRKEYK